MIVGNWYILGPYDDCPACERKIFNVISLHKYPIFNVICLSCKCETTTSSLQEGLVEIPSKLNRFLDYVTR